MKTASILDEIYAPIAGPVKNVPGQILKILESSNPLIQDIFRHFFQAQGKMLRPAMTFLGAAVARPSFEINDNEKLLNLAAAFEIFHAATLIHDDIIDRAELRRGLVSVNAQWGSPVAVLAGDFLHDRALVTIFENSHSDIMRLFLKTAGIVCDGEIHELRRVRFYDLTEAEYFEIIYKKTASLLACVLESGARTAGATESEARALAEFGRHFGNAFQMIDDCLDFTANQVELGKTLGTDLAAGVLTLPLIRLLETRPDLRPQILNLIEHSASRENLNQLTRLIFENGALDYVFQRARESTQRALLSLSVFPDSAARQSLEKLAGYILERTK